MLERTAATIEPCTIQRVLPSTRTCLPSRRKLHTAFWNHGAAELELLDVFMRPPSSQSKVPELPAQQTSKQDTMTTAPTVLDFLFPGGTTALLRRPYPTYSLRLEPGSRPGMPISRLFTSAAPRQSHQPGSAPFAEPESPGEHAAQREYWELPLEEQEPDEPVSAEPTVTFSDPDALRSLLNSDRTGSYEQIFQLYTNLPPDRRDEFTTDVLLALSSSPRPTEAWRLNSLFALYRVGEWTEEIACAAIKAQLTLHNVPAAMSIFRAAVEQRGFGRGLDYLAAYALEHSTWSILLEAWELFSTINQDSDPETHSPTAPEPGVAAESDMLRRTRDIGPAIDSKEGENAQPGVGSATAIEDAVFEPTVAHDAAPAPDSITVRDAVTEASATKGAESVGKLAQQSTDLAVDSTAARDVESLTEPSTPQDFDSVADSAVEDADLAANLTPQSSSPSVEDLAGPLAAEQRTRGYPTIAKVANFTSKVSQLYESLKNDPKTLPYRTDQVDQFLELLAKHSLDLFRPSDAVFILDRIKDPHAYERYILFSTEGGRKRLAAALYWIYRALPGVHVADFILRAMIEVFHPHDVRGMEQVLADWYRGYGRLDERAYRKFMTFYSSRGDVKSILRLADEYAKHHSSQVKEDPKFVVTLMNAYAVKGDPDAAREVMEEAVEKTGVEPGTIMLNVLLNAYSKAGDYEGAINLFLRICQEHEPDTTTFGTMMGMAAWRGDLQFTLELFQLAKDRKMQPSVNMIRAVVEAYCQNDRYAEAEKLCLEVTKHREVSGDYTLLWNTLLNHNAKRRDLTTVNRLLEFMSAQGITYNQDTYSHLLLALLYCRQSHHAMHLLRVAHREGVFQPTPDHFILLMATFIKSGEPHMALKTNKVMAKLNFPESASRMTKVIDALGRWQELPSNRREGVDGQHFLKKILKEFYKAMEKVDNGSSDSMRSVVNLYSKMLFILTQMREHATVQQLIQLHNSRYPNRSSPQEMPIKLLHNIMLADFFEKKYDRVKETWRIVVQRTARRYRTAAAVLDKESSEGEQAASSKPVAYAMRFRLGDPLKTMQRLHLEERDAEGLMATVDEVRRLGFELDSKNWNYYVQALAQLKEWREAFTTCEQVLMPQWAGWYMVRARTDKSKNQLPLELRRLGSNPARPRPIAHTLIILAKEYMDLDQMRLWSHEASREFEFITSRCPKTVRAITTMVRTGSELEARVFGDREKATPAEHPEPADENEAYFREQLAAAAEEEEKQQQLQQGETGKAETTEDLSREEDENRREWVDRRERREKQREERRQRRKKQERERRREMEKRGGGWEQGYDYAVHDDIARSPDGGFADADADGSSIIAPPQRPVPPPRDNAEGTMPSQSCPERERKQQQPRRDDRRVGRERKKPERDGPVPYHEIWSAEGYLNAVEDAGALEKGRLADEDVVKALREGKSRK